MCFKGEALRGLDIFGAQIGLNYKGANTFSTKIGGACTLLLYVLLVSLAVDSLQSFFSGDTVQRQIDTVFTEYTNTTSNEWQLNTTSFTQAGMLTFVEKSDEDIEVSQAARV